MTTAKSAKPTWYGSGRTDRGSSSQSRHAPNEQKFKEWAKAHLDGKRCVYCGYKADRGEYPYWLTCDAHSDLVSVDPFYGSIRQRMA